jgi:hypothetical protein
MEVRKTEERGELRQQKNRGKNLKFKFNFESIRRAEKDNLRSRDQGSEEQRHLPRLILPQNEGEGGNPRSGT